MGGALADVNVLLALVSARHERHAAAHAWFADAGEWLTTPLTEAGFLRLVLNPAVVGGRVEGVDALRLLSDLRTRGTHRLLSDSASLAEPVIDLSVLSGHQQVTDLHLVNLAASTGNRLATFDRRLVASLAPADRVHVELIAGERA